MAASLGLPGNPPEAVDAARSKVRTRELSARLGLPTPKLLPLASGFPLSSSPSSARAQRVASGWTTSSRYPACTSSSAPSSHLSTMIGSALAAVSS